MRRGVGLAAIKNKVKDEEMFKDKGKALQEEHISHVRSQLDTFRRALQDFAGKYKSRINSDPEFRHYFHKMCETIDVDPLASNKGFWGDVLGIGDYYYELGVIIIEISVQIRPINGGIISLKEMQRKIQGNSNIPSRQQVTEEDIRRAVNKLKILGNGFQIVEMNGQGVIVSVPMELNRDHEEVFNMATANGFVTEDMLLSHGWTRDRFHHILTTLLNEGMVWIDDYAGARAYYFPCFMNEF